MTVGGNPDVLSSLVGVKTSVFREAGRDDVALLHQVMQELLSSERDIEPVLKAVLGHLSAYAGMERGMITVLDPSKDLAHVDLAYGLSEAQQKRGRYRPGEGVIGKVLERGEPALIPRIGDEPQFLDRTQSRANLDLSSMAFLCVPIMHDGVVIGTLSVDRVGGFTADTLKDDLRVLSIIGMMIGKAVLQRREQREELESLVRDKHRISEAMRDSPISSIVGTSRPIRGLLDMVRQAAPADVTVLIRGESGTGKELVAEAVHSLGARAHGPFVAVNCGSIPESLVESELFGHVRGAFTGALSHRVGKLEAAHGGTLFLDEIGDLSLSSQVKLLRALQSRQVERIGENRPRSIDVRVIAATNVNLERAIQEGRFREDLFYRLNVFPLFVPPLRERKADITLLADYFVDKYARQQGRDVRRITTPAIDLMMAYHWPGNVRELENCIARAVLLCTDGAIREHHLPPTLQTGTSSGTTQKGTLHELMMRYEREILIEAIKNAQGNQAQAARTLGTTARILGYRLRRHGLHGVFAPEKR